MKIQNKFIALSVAALSLTMVSCDDFLDKLPDNRMELDDATDIKDLLVSAYPDRHPAYLLEMYSDNSDAYDVTGWTSADKFQEEAWNWEDITSVSNDESPQELWNSHYRAVASANQSLLAIANSEDQSSFSAVKGEALLCRAYAMFQLANIFCEAYDETTAANKLGLPYPTTPETKVGEEYKRGTLADLYKNINADIEEGLPLVSDAYDHPKFHFNKSAAYAFAARFNLYAHNYQKAVDYATIVLGNQPSAKLRDWSSFYKLSANGQVAPNGYVKSTESANLLLQTTYSEWGAVYGPYGYANMYAHGEAVAQYETLRSSAPWGSNAQMGYNIWSNNSLSKVFINKILYNFEYTDLQAKIGYAHSCLPEFTSDETLLVRAEAYALLGNYASAVEDLNTELAAMSAGKFSTSLDQIKTFYNGLEYYTPTAPTAKKKFNTSFAIESKTQEPVINAILQLRRILTLGEGKRMQDVKRYGIVIYRRVLDSSAKIISVTDSMGVDDPRRAIQLPQDVITAGLDANPRTK